jgi:isocitrate dehydrogenase kinase/phosphatase
MTDTPALARAAAAAVLQAFDRFQASFAAITWRAASRFARRDWDGMHGDVVERLSLYGASLGDLVAECAALLGEGAHDGRVWRALRKEFSTAVAGRGDVEIAETYFNSLTRRVFTTVGVNQEIEFVAPDLDVPIGAGTEPRCDTFRWTGGDTAGLLRTILADRQLNAPFADLAGDAARGAAALAAQMAGSGAVAAAGEVDVLRPVFYRSRRAYVVGRIRAADRLLPLVLALVNTEAGVELDAVLTVEDEVSIVFSFARSYFHVEADRPRELVAFLRSIMPRKPVAELYTSIGHHKHGKTELYRALVRRLAQSSDRFEVAPGERGLVMLVFTLPSWDVVFKVIRDVAGPPKRTTRRDVLDHYRLVFTRDRVGRLVDAQEFEHLSFARERFASDLLDELVRHAPGSVAVDGNTVTIAHLFTERRLTPLNLYIRSASADAAAAAVIDLGHAIKELAAANIFPGDLLLKNFGVTRHGRVVFYDYDELCLLDTCVFRDLPRSRDVDDDLADEPWFSVGENDIFPEELRRFLGLPPELRAIFEARHGDLFDVAFWQQAQARCRAGDLLELAPYRPERRLRPDRPLSS